MKSQREDHGFHAVLSMSAGYRYSAPGIDSVAADRKLTQFRPLC